MAGLFTDGFLGLLLLLVRGLDGREGSGCRIGPLGSGQKYLACLPRQAGMARPVRMRRKFMVPEGPPKLAGGGASLRARTTGIHPT